MLGGILVAILLLVLGLALWIRLAPIDPARWHVDIAGEDYEPPPRAAAFCQPADARVSFAAGDLAALDAIAMAWPRTRRLAGSVADGHVTWVTRTRLMAYPDFTTAQVRGDRLCVIARQGIGQEDWGVNTRRLEAWLQALGGLNEPPELKWE